VHDEPKLDFSRNPFKNLGKVKNFKNISILSKIFLFINIVSIMEFVNILDISDMYAVIPHSYKANYLDELF